MTFEEFLRSPYLSVIGDKMMEENKKKLERKYIALNEFAKQGESVIFGDSIVEYLPVQELFTQKIFNRGIGGDTSEETLKRLKKVVLPLKPSKAMLWVGTNDLHTGVSIEQILQNVTTICKDLETECNSRIYILSVAPVNTASCDPQIKMAVGNRTNQKICELNAAYQTLCKEHGWEFINVYDALVLNGTLPDELSDDGLHPNIKGYQIVVPILEKYIFGK